MRILKTFADVRPHLSAVREFADQNRSALGFLTKATFEEKAWGNKLWVATDDKTVECVGYLLFGGIFPSLKIFQLFVSPSHRQQGIGRRLVGQLAETGEAGNYLSIWVRVAADLSANKFWEHLGFNWVRQEPGGISTRRTINVRIRDLETPSLLKSMGLATKPPSTKITELRFSRPISRSPIYVLDLNVFFDVIKRRMFHQEATNIMQAGFNHQISPRVTPEFTKELERHADPTGEDPVLEFARTLPTLPEIEPTELDPLLSHLQSIVFPTQSQSGEGAKRMYSDLTHLAYCIHHRATGFVSRDKAMLAAGARLKRDYDLEVIHPADVVQAYVPRNDLGARVSALYHKSRVSIERAKEPERSETELFLKKMGLDPEARAIVWDPGSSGTTRRRITIRYEDQLIGAASWDVAGRFNRDVRLYFYLNEENPATDRVIDHVFETVFRDSEAFISRRIFLYTTSDQDRTTTTAIERGFIKPQLHDLGDNPIRLAKFCFRGVVTEDNWARFRNELRQAMGLRLPNVLPTAAEFLNTGIRMEMADGHLPWLISLFDFETLTSPAIILCPGRTGLIVPIRSRFAGDLFPEVNEQPQLFPSKEAILHVEKAYFRSPRNLKFFAKGTPVLFYQSGKGSQELIGCGRVTYSEVLTVEQVGVSVWRQGVLSDSELRKIADKSNNIHVFTFDNFNLFPRRVPYGYLRDKKMISGANLVTVERLRPKHTLEICKYGFEFE